VFDPVWFSLGRKLPAAIYTAVRSARIILFLMLYKSYFALGHNKWRIFCLDGLWYLFGFLFLHDRRSTAAIFNNPVSIHGSQ
jgi:hypothetical protein